MASTYHPRVYAYHKRTVNGMDYGRSGRYSGDGVKHCWNLVQRGKFEQRDGQAHLAAMPSALTWGRGMAYHTVVGSGTGVYVSPNDAAMQSVAKVEPWNVLDITGIQAWFDASDESTFTFVDGRIQYWYDKSPNGLAALQNTVARRPVRVWLSDLGWTVRFQQDRRLRTTTDTGLDSQPWTWVMVVRVLELNRQQAIIANADQPYFELSSTTNFGLWTGSSTLSTPAALGDFFIIIEGNGATSRIVVNRDTIVSGSTGTRDWANRTNIGSRDSDRYFNGHIAELIGVDRLLSADEILELGFYVQRKYGI